MQGTVFHIPLETAQTPKSGHCIVDHYWAVHPEKGVAFYAQLHGYTRCEEPSPQCNASEHTCRYIMSRMYPDHEVRHIPVVYTQHAVKEMNRMRKQPA